MMEKSDPPVPDIMHSVHLWEMLASWPSVSDFVTLLAARERHCRTLTIDRHNETAHGCSLASFAIS